MPTLPEENAPLAKFRRLYGANLTVIASLSFSGMGEAMLLDGSADAAAFEASIEQILAALPAPRTNRDPGQPFHSPGFSREKRHRSQRLSTAVLACVFS